ncbi:MAG: hypothetical protein ACXWE1_06550 [Thermoanaerobaculia bacterium]
MAAGHGERISPGCFRPLRTLTRTGASELAAQGGLPLPILYVAHEEAEVAALADEVVVLDAGHLAARGAPVDVLQDGTPGRTD